MQQNKKYRYDLDEFYRIYLNEFTKATLYQFLTEDVVYELRFNVNVTNSYGQKYTNNHRYPVYKSFKETIAFIEKMGLPSFANTAEIKLKNLEVYGSKYSDNHMYIEDAETLEKIKPYLIPSQFVNDQVDHHVYCDLRYEYNDEERYTSVYISEEDFLKIVGQ